MGRSSATQVDPKADSLHSHPEVLYVPDAHPDESTENRYHDMADMLIAVATVQGIVFCISLLHPSR